MELETLKNEVLRKIGRNVMLFQQMEYMLKCFLANGQFSGYASELAKNIEQRRETIHKQTMGQVVKQCLEKIFSAFKETTNAPEELTAAWVSFRYTIECDDTYYEGRKNALDSIVAERNDLIHHLLPKWNSSSLESSIATEQYLDQQREKILPEFELLKSQIQAMQETIKKHTDFLASDEGEKQVELSFLRGSQLVAWLFEAAKQRARPDGWVALSNAAQFIRLHVPEEVADLEKIYGHKKLKDIILATELFDIIDEPTDKGGVRVLYRIKPDLKTLQLNT